MKNKFVLNWHEIEILREYLWRRHEGLNKYICKLGYDRVMANIIIDNIMMFIEEYFSNAIDKKPKKEDHINIQKKLKKYIFENEEMLETYFF